MSFGPFFVGEQPSFSFPIRDADTDAVIDLTGYTAKIMLRKAGAAANRFPTPADENGTITTPTNGIVTYTMPAAWLTADEGEWIVQLQLTLAAVIRKTEKVSFRVEAALTPSP